MTGKARNTHPVTSHEAADEFTEERLNSLQAAMLAWFHHHREGTDSEIAVALNWNPTTARVRRIELTEKGFIRDSGRKKLNNNKRRMIVWELTVRTPEQGQLWGQRLPLPPPQSSKKERSRDGMIEQDEFVF